ncbi:MAG: recombinase family protein [Lachnospiraceae bacterium]|nr:recombinase family protein [Lachnospiraceae bacterium]
MLENQQTQYVEMAYARISTKKQSLERQEASIMKTVPDIKMKYFFEDKYTGKEFNREHYLELKDKILELKEANPDTRIRVTVHELDRLGRNYKEIKKEIDWFRGHDVKLRFLDIPEELCGENMGITGELLVDIIVSLKAYWAEQELHYKEKRSREGTAKALARGVRFGRQAIEVDEKIFRKEADRAIARYITHKEAMNNLGLKDYVYWKWIKQLYPDYQSNKKKVKKMGDNNINCE